MNLNTPASAPWRDVTPVTSVAPWNGALFGRRPRRDPWPALAEHHRALVRIERDLREAVAVARELRGAADGLWCHVMREEIRRAVDEFLLVARGGMGEATFDPGVALRRLRGLVGLADAVLGCVGILDDFEPLQGARDRADQLLRGAAV